MTAFTVSDLLNPEPDVTTDASPAGKIIMDESEHHSADNSAFAPELFQSHADSLTAVQNIDPMITDTTESLTFNDEATSYPDPSMMSGLETYTDRVEETPESNGFRSTSPVSLKKPAHGKSTKQQRDSDRLKDTKHSSKNEGQHTDRRYLCYLCNKLFTRRRSVRDHLNKIHGEKTWEPTRSLEIVVEPHSGEPLEPLDELIARGPPPPPPKGERERKSKQQIKDEEDEEDDNEEEEQHETSKESASEERRDSAVQPPPEIPRLKTESSVPESRVASTEPSVLPAPVIGKKRPLPVNKKGIAKTKSATAPNKRPRLAESEASTPTRSPSATPAHKASYQQRFKKLADSPVPSSRASSRDVSPSPTSSDAESDGSTNDDGEVFCICRKGDNHTWMIACDGPCEEWYHGKCVNIRERDGDLIDKYICPRCTRDGYVTTWKRMCRHKDCRKPAQVLKIPPSKYCSVECGRKFFVELLQRGDPHAEATKDSQHVLPESVSKKMKRIPLKAKVRGNDTPVLNSSRAHTPAYSDDEQDGYETDSSLDDEQLPNRGGPLRAGEVKAILQKCQTVEAWRSLGKKPDTPPREDDGGEFVELEYDDYQKDRLAIIKTEAAELRHRNELLSAREKLLDLIKTRSASITDEVKKGNSKLKDLCGYDPRIGWSEAEFARWWQDQGRQTLESGKIGPPEDTHMQNGHDGNPSDEDEKSATTKGGVCIKNRCQKHGSNKWQRAQLAELRFEQDIVKRLQERLELQEKEIRDVAVLRAWEVKGRM